MPETDGIDEALEGTLQMALTAAARMGEVIARRREQAERDAQAHSQRRAAEYADRLAAERQAARAALAPVRRAEWWDGAQPEDIATAYQTAAAWAGTDPEAARAQQRITQEVRTRYGIGIAAGFPADPAALRQAMNKTAKERTAARRDAAEGAALVAEADAIDRTGQTAPRRDPAAAEPGFPAHEFRHEADYYPRLSKARAIAYLNGQYAYAGDVDLNDWKGRDPDVDALLAAKYPALFAEERAAADNARGSADAAQAASLTTADADQQRERADKADNPEHADALADRAGQDSADAYDSAERRQHMASNLEGTADAAAIDARVRADTAQARPATEATRTAGTRTTKARRKPGKPGKTIQRSGLSR